MKISPVTILRIVAFLFFLLVWNFSGLTLLWSVILASIPYGIGFLILFAAGLTDKPKKYGNYGSQAMDNSVANMAYKPKQ